MSELTPRERKDRIYAFANTLGYEVRHLEYIPEWRPPAPPAVPQGTEGERAHVKLGRQSGNERENVAEALYYAINGIAAYPWQEMDGGSDVREHYRAKADAALAAPSPEPQGDEGERERLIKAWKHGHYIAEGRENAEQVQSLAEVCADDILRAAPQPQGEREAEATADHGEFAAVLATLPLDKWEAIVRKSADRWLAEQAAASESESKDAPPSTPEEER